MTITAVRAKDHVELGIPFGQLNAIISLDRPPRLGEEIARLTNNGERKSGSC